MRNRALRSLALVVICGLGGEPATACRGGEKMATPTKNVLVELYSSQGCNSCPPAADVLGKLAPTGSGSGTGASPRVVALNFHVDYFNNPWADPYSDASFSDRQLSYNQVLGREDLYFTPMMMVDGRAPLLGSNGAKAAASIQQARSEAPGVDLGLDLAGSGDRKNLTVKLATRSAEVTGRDLLVGVAITQDHATTRVPRGENAGKTLEEFHVVRRLDHKFTKLDRSAPTTLTFPVSLPTGADPANFHVAVFVQDRHRGQVHQAEALPWLGEPTPLRTARP